MKIDAKKISQTSRQTSKSFFILSGPRTKSSIFIRAGHDANKLTPLSLEEVSTCWRAHPLKHLTWAVVFLFLIVIGECDAEPYRIVSLAPNTTEILFVLGLGDYIVGVDKYSNYPETAREIEHVGTFDRPNIERITLLRPDYILVGADMEKDRADYLEKLGAKIVKISPKTVEELCDNIKMLGILFHKGVQAELIVGDIKTRIREVSRNIKKDRPKVFVQLFNDPLVTVSSFISDIIRISGGENIARDVKDEAALFSYEVLLQRNPDVMIVVGFSKEWDLPDSISAVRKNRIFKDLNPDILLRPGPRVIDAIEELNRIFYEED